MTVPQAAPPLSRARSRPTWEIAQLFPNQGDWSEEEYLALGTNRLVEYVDGRLEFPPMPKTSHQIITLFLLRALLAFAEPRGLGLALQAGVRVRLWKGRIREPDVVFMLADNRARCGEDCWDRADLVMEVVSPDDPGRDLEVKRVECARAGIPEYWVVEPLAKRITVLKLRGKRYSVHGEFGKGEKATSTLLPGFSVEVTAALKTE
jgi:Uma2 family endonuclease